MKMISVGIDVSKGKSTVAIMKPGGEVLVAPFDVTHTQESLSRLVGRFEEFDEDVRVVLEATGNYHLPITVFLAENGIFVSVVNALRMNKFCSQDLRRAKTDKKDALKIAAYGIMYWNELTAYSAADETYSQLRILSRQYHQIVSILVKSKVNLSNLLDQVMPVIKTLLVDSKGNYKLSKFVERYYHFDNIVNMGERRFTSDYCKWAKNRDT
jgi:transposase